MGFTPGQNNGVQRVTKQGENNEKIRNVTFILGYMDYMWLYGLYVVLWVMWVICGYYPQSYVYFFTPVPSSVIAATVPAEFSGQKKWRLAIMAYKAIQLTIAHFHAFVGEVSWWLNVAALHAGEICTKACCNCTA